ncbi:Prenyltransferase family protein containing thioredoxin domain [Halapricum desulfuricans]|uniref:Prenyltransferase family protein containing thioredoxin domain n=1 Tax=Halapricum desulfuricans TaxID=2841257 RepID=A0A897NKC7_9EURY|nr:AGE family epimerase/isomerase [Halapricum desulfuricans]QSG13207.1 Prenyltransferase family protein containing thioredoxin domain [Halapricum desulfuricans]
MEDPIERKNMESDYSDPDWLRDRLIDVLSYHYPDCIDVANKGYIAQLDEETGEVYDKESKHLVATSRYIVNFSIGDRCDGPDWCHPAAEHGVSHLWNYHRNPDTGGYDWLLAGTKTADDTRVCYGHAFVLLAYARAYEAGIDSTRTALEETYDLLIDQFWEPEYNLCKSEYTGDFSESEDYRGQNANMHTCEAMLAAYEATGEQRYLDRAREIAYALTVRLAEETNGLLWEHYTNNWEHDFAYNRDDPRHQFRPWGYQPGHHIEWAKLLAVLDRYTDTEWALIRAVELFDVAVEHGWDDKYGGFYYTFDRKREPIIEDKYGWPVAEGIGAAAALFERTSDDRFKQWYDRLWDYAQQHLTAPGGNWYEKLSRTNDPYETEPGPTVEPGYHPIGACFEGIRSFEE